MRRPVTTAQVVTVTGAGSATRRDHLATEEPMEIRVHGPGQEPTAFAVAMRTPGNDFELAVGLCCTEGLVTSPAEIDTIAYCLAADASDPAGKPEQQYNIVTVRLRRPVLDDLRERRYLANSSCGICGKAALDEVEARCAPVRRGPDCRGKCRAVVARPARRASARVRPNGRVARGGALHGGR